jgi:chromosome segregation ATPase
MRRLSFVLGLMVAGACASHKQEAKLDESGLARLNEQQMQPVDDARVELGRAQDAVARAKAGEQDARAQMEVAKSEHDVADAQLKRATAQRDLLKKQYADQDSMARADQDIRAAQERLKAADLKLQYLNQLIATRTAERKAAEAHVGTAQALTEQAKYRAMEENNIPQAQSVNSGEMDKRVADARANEANAERDAAGQRAKAVDLYNQWQKMDAQTRAISSTNLVTVPPPISEPQSH